MFFEQQFPVDYGFGAKGGPVFSTEVTKTTSGARYVNQNWLYPIHRYDISAGIKVEQDFEVYRAFFYNVRGQFDGFRFKDWHDYLLNVQPMIELTPGAAYQLQRVYVAGVRTFSRPILKPVPGSITIFRNRAGAYSGITATVDYTSGVVTGITGHMMGDTYCASGKFDVPVAFTSDMLEAIILDKRAGDGSLIVSWPTVQIEELRNP